MAAFTYETLAAAPASWTSPEFEGRESAFEQIVNAGAVMNRLRPFDWMREEIKPAESTGSRVGNQAGGSARKETVQHGARPFTGYAKGNAALPDAVPATALQPPSQTFGSDPSVWNLYPYVASNPLTRTDPDGRSGTVVGGIAGGLAGGLWELGRQAISGEDINWRKVAGSAARGAVVGAMMGSVIDTGGASLPVLLGTGVLSNVAGGELDRRISGEETTFQSVANDVAGGLVIGFAGALAPKIRPYAGAAPATRAASSLTRLTTTAEQSSFTVSDDAASSVIRTAEGTAPKAYGTPYRQLSSRQVSRLQNKVDSRTITRDEWKRLDWHERLQMRRQRGRDAFWSAEREKLADKLPATRNWSQEAAEEILAGRQPRGIFSHHKYSVSQYPQLADDPNNIFPATFFEHFFRWHGGSWRLPTHGKPLKPDYAEWF